MELRILSGIACTIAVLTCTAYFKRNEKTAHNNTNQPYQGLSQNKEAKLEKAENSSVNKTEPELLMEELDLHIQENYTKPVEDKMFPTHACSLDQVFFILLIDTFGADLVSTLSTVFDNMFSIEGLVELAFSFITSVCIVKMWKRGEDAEADKKTLSRDQDELLTLLMEVKTDLKKQKDHITEQQEEVEREQEVIRQKCQALENEIKEGEETLEKPDELLRERERLQEQRIRLDQIKDLNKRKLEKTERLLGPIEAKLNVMKRRKMPH